MMDEFRTGGRLREPEETLRKLAGMPAPEGLEDRVHRRLGLLGEPRRQAGLWSLWIPVRRMQYAAAAVLAIVVAGSAWTVYRGGGPRTGGAETTAPVEIPGKSFGASAARTLPDSVTPIQVTDTGGRAGSDTVVSGAKRARLKKKKPSAKVVARRPERSAAVAAKPAD